MLTASSAWIDVESIELKCQRSLLGVWKITVDVSLLVSKIRSLVHHR